MNTHFVTLIILDFSGKVQGREKIAIEKNRLWSEAGWGKGKQELFQGVLK